MRAYRALAAAAFAALLPGCYTSLTKPTGVVDYLGRMRLNVGYVIDAPTYMKTVRELRRETGRPPYRLNVGIRLRVAVYGRGIDAAVNVAPDGAVDLPLVGRVKAAGKPIDAFREELQKLYEPYFVEKPQISVNVEEFQNFGPRGLFAGRVIVLSKEGGTGAITTNRTVDLQGDERLAEVIARTGGLGEFSDWKQIAVIRQAPYDPDGAESEEASREALIIVCDIERYIKEADVDQNIPIRHQDVVFIPTRPNTLLEEVQASLHAWLNTLAPAEDIHDIVKRIGDW